MNSEYTVVINEPDILSGICGVNDTNVQLLASYLGVPVHIRGNELTVTAGDEAVRSHFKNVIEYLSTGFSEGSPSAEERIRVYFENNANVAEIQQSMNTFCRTAIRIPHGYSPIYAKTLRQAEYIRGLQTHEMVFCSGPAGSGKTFLAVAEALRLVLTKKKRKLLLTRPVVEAGESLGFLPGDLEQKLDPYLRPLYDSIEDLVPPEILKRLEDTHSIEIAPLAYMRGRTLKDCAIILDEAQNTTQEQMKMFLTRIGRNSSAFITGDLSQTDLPRQVSSGFSQALSVLSDIEEIFMIQMGGRDIIRNPLVRKIVKAYEQKRLD